MKKNVCLISAALTVILFVSCSGKSVNTIKRMQKLEENVSNPTTIEELKSAIKKYEDRANDIMLAQEQTGIWYKLLGTKYLNEKMYGEALKAYESALEYYPANQNLYYWVGVCAGYMAKESLDFNGSGKNEVKQNYFELAESSYKRALELDDRYERAWYGLGVIYEEFADYGNAADCFEHALEISTKSIDTMLHLARCYYGNYDFDKSADMYDQVIKLTKSENTKKQAEELKKQVLDTSYGDEGAAE